jgi:hypothetical protein
MRFVPTNTSREIVLRFSDGREVVCHFAQDLSGEEQPPFRGWFVPNGRGTGYSEVETKGANGWKFADEG